MQCHMHTVVLYTTGGVGEEGRGKEMKEERVRPCSCINLIEVGTRHTVQDPLTVGAVHHHECGQL